MITTEGDVIGVNTAMIQGAQGLSFSVDINTAKEIAQQLIHHGKVFKAYVGVMLQEININPKIKQHFNLSNKKGLFVTRLEPESPASRSQLQEGDIIITDTLQLENLDFNAFRASVESIQLALASHLETLSAYREC